MTEKIQLVFASNNANKVAEIAMAVPAHYEILSLKDIGCEVDIPETGALLEDNARIKARYVAEHYGLNVFADDTGLEVHALGGAPGVHSARYAGEARDNELNIAKLQKELADASDRAAQFRTVICLILNGEEHLFEGIAEGEILGQKTGDGGFGYDPVFKPAGFEESFAQMSRESKNEISHRGKAMRKLIHFLENHGS